MKEWQSRVVHYCSTPLSENISYTCHGRQVSFPQKKQKLGPLPLLMQQLCCALRLENARHYMPEQVNNSLPRLAANNGP